MKLRVQLQCKNLHEYLRELSPEILDRLYNHPATCLAVYRFDGSSPHTTVISFVKLSCNVSFYSCFDSVQRASFSGKDFCDANAVYRSSSTPGWSDSLGDKRESEVNTNIPSDLFLHPLIHPSHQPGQKIGSWILRCLILFSLLIGIILCCSYICRFKLSFNVLLLHWLALCLKYILHK